MDKLKISVDDEFISEVEVPKNKTKKMEEYFSKQTLTDYVNDFIKAIVPVTIGAAILVPSHDWNPPRGKEL